MPNNKIEKGLKITIENQKPIIENGVKPTYEKPKENTPPSTSTEKQNGTK